VQRPVDAGEVDVDHPLEVLGGDLAHGAVAGDAGVGEDEVDATEVLSRSVDRRGQLGGVAHVRLPPGVLGAELGDDGLQLVGLEPDEGDASASAGQLTGDPRSDAAGSTGDERDVASEVGSHGIQDTVGI